MASAGTASVDIELNFDNVDSALADAIAGLEAPPLDVPVDADLASLESDLASLEASPVDVPVDADVAAAAAELEGLEGSPVDIPVSADTAAAQASIDDLSASTSALGDAAQGALGGMGGLDGAAAGLTGSLGASAVAGAGAAAGLFEFAQSAIDAESATQRFGYVAGGLSSELSSIDVGGLSGDIGDLAVKIGSSDEAMLTATASFVTFAESTGASDAAIVEASDNINALALRAAALNPSLGDAGAVAERMTTAFQRGGRALVPFGLGLSSAEINARAMADTGKTNVAELTAFEKAAAGAALATERLGDSMGEDFQAGSENARTEWNRMTEQLGESSETVGGTMLPAIENITEAVTELGSGLTNLSPRDWLSGLWDLSGGLVANGFTDLWGAVGLGEDTLRGVGTLVGELPPALQGTADAADDAAGSFADLSAQMSAYLDEVVNIPASQRDVQQSITDLVATMSDGESSWFDMADAQDEVVTSTADLVAGMAEQNASHGELNAVITNTIAMLRAEKEAGRITTQQFNDLTAEIRGIPTKASTTTTAPGLSQVFGTATNYRAMMDRIDGDTVSTGYVADGLSRIYTDAVNYRAIMNDLDGRVVETYYKSFGDKIPKNARGTESAAPGLSWVGEEGPELIALSGGERIWSHPESMAMAGAGSTVTNHHYTVNVTAPLGARAPEFAQAVVDAIRDHERANGSGWRNN